MGEKRKKSSSFWWISRGICICQLILVLILSFALLVRPGWAIFSCGRVHTPFCIAPLFFGLISVFAILFGLSWTSKETILILRRKRSICSNPIRLKSCMDQIILLTPWSDLWDWLYDIPAKIKSLWCPFLFMFLCKLWWLFWLAWLMIRPALSCILQFCYWSRQKVYEYLMNDVCDLHSKKIIFFNLDGFTLLWVQLYKCILRIWMYKCPLCARSDSWKQSFYLALEWGNDSVNPTFSRPCICRIPLGLFLMLLGAICMEIDRWFALNLYNPLKVLLAHSQILQMIMSW